MFARDLTDLPALLYSVELQADGSGLLRFYASGTGALVARARGLAKTTSKLAPQLKPADELSIDLAQGRSRTPVLTGVRQTRDHAVWRQDLSRQALQWFMVECAYTGSGEQEANQQVYQLIVNLLRHEPGADQLAGAGCAFCLRFLALHGLLPDLRNCAVSGARLNSGEPALWLPSRDGFVSLDVYNTKYARSGRGFIRLDSVRLPRWRKLLSGKLLDYPEREFDATDAALLIGMAQQSMGDVAARPVASATFLIRQWGLKPLAELAVERES